MRGALLALSLVLLSSPAPSWAQDGPTPNPFALDFAPVDLLTLRFGVGAARGFDADRSTLDLRVGLTGVSAAFLGFQGRALEVDFAGRTGLSGSSVGATLLSIDAWMVGLGNTDDRLCVFWPGVLCDQASGFWGGATTLLGVVHDWDSGRTGIRLFEFAAVGSPGPAFDAGWSKRRLLPRLGFSLDHVGGLPGVDRWLPRLSVGADGRLVLGPVDLTPSVRWRPKVSDFGGDWGLQVSIEATLRTRWPGFSKSGAALRFGLIVGYEYWATPSNAYSLDQVSPARHTGFVRLTIAPSLFSAVPPAGL